MIFEHSDYRSYLRAELADRSTRNPSYSLRAMSRNLGVSAAQLSQVLSGKANLSISAARRVAVKLELDPKKTEYFCLLVQAGTELDPEIHSQLIERAQELRPSGRPIMDLTTDFFRQISDWYHWGALELINLHGFELSAESVAQKLGITRIVAQSAIDRLERLELISKNGSGRWVRSNNDLQFSSPIKSAAMRAFYRQMFEKISAALDHQEPFQERVSGFETIPISPDALPEANQVIEKFFEDMIRVARKSPKKTRVYHLSVHFINLTHERKSYETE